MTVWLVGRVTWQEGRMLGGDGGMMDREGGMLGGEGGMLGGVERRRDWCGIRVQRGDLSPSDPGPGA